jgi:hypothetical protein
VELGALVFFLTFAFRNGKSFSRRALAITATIDVSTYAIAMLSSGGVSRQTSEFLVWVASLTLVGACGFAGPSLSKRLILAVPASIAAILLAAIPLFVLLFWLGCTINSACP